jgi:diadenosine tetraphosphatase ApaH/serine/threonine PP2A family protein phosphatase
VEGDRLVAVGDLVNKGPDSPGVLDLVMSQGIRCVLGNHEARLLKALDENPASIEPKAAKLLRNLGPRVRDFAETIRSWPLWLDLGDLLVVHAGLQPGVERLEDMSRKVLLTVRTWDGKGDRLDWPDDPAWFDCMRWKTTVVFGHWAMLGFVDRPDVKGLDTGCVYGRMLTGWCPEEALFYQVKARAEYAPFR